MQSVEKPSFSQQMISTGVKLHDWLYLENLSKEIIKNTVMGDASFYSALASWVERH
jgi:hypothetical protein